MLKKILSIWKDQVWSNVISWAIIGIFGFIFTLFKCEMSKNAIIKCKNTIPFLYQSIQNISKHDFKYLTIILILIIILIVLAFSLIAEKNKRKILEFRIKKLNSSSLEWLENLSDEDVKKYSFLIWFPANRSLKSEKYRKVIGTKRMGDVTFDHIPEINTLCNRKVLFYSGNGTYYSINIDQNCYNFLEKKLEDALKISGPEENKNILEALHSYEQIQFCECFGQKYF